MRRALFSLLTLPFLFGITFANNGFQDADGYSREEVSGAKKALGNKAAIFDSLVPLFKAKDKETQDAVRALLVIFKSSRDPYTRNIGIYFGYLITIAYGDSEEDQNINDNQNGNDNTNNNDNQVDNTVSNGSLTIASSSASSTVILDGANTELVTFSATVKDRSYDLSKVTIGLKTTSETDSLIGQSLTLQIDGQSVGSSIYNGGTTMIISNLNESLAQGKHTFVVKANANVGNNGSALVDIKSVQLNSDDAIAISVKKLIVKAYPVISSTTMDEDLTLKIKNPNDNNEDFKIIGFLIDGNVVSTSFNDKNIDLGTSTSLNSIISNINTDLADGDMVELRIQAAKNSTVKVKGIIIKSNGNTYIIDDQYSNIGKWTSFKVTAGDKGSNGKYRLESKTNDTYIYKINSDSGDNDDQSSYIPASEISIASSNSSNTVVRYGTNIEFSSINITVKNGAYNLSNITYDVEGFYNTNCTLEIDGSAIDTSNVSNNKLSFNNLNETLSVGKHTITLKGNANAGDMGMIKINGVKITDEYGKSTEKNLEISKLIARAYPTISASISSEDLILRIKNPQDMDEDIEIVGFLVDGKVITASLDGRNIDLSSNTSLNSIISSMNVSIAPGDNTELIIQAAKNSTVKVKGIIIKSNENTYIINDQYTNIGKWTSFKVTAGDKGSNGKYKLESSYDDTTITYYN